jgi:hypothetical protein
MRAAVIVFFLVTLCAGALDWTAAVSASSISTMQSSDSKQYWTGNNRGSSTQQLALMLQLLCKDLTLLLLLLLLLLVAGRSTGCTKAPFGSDRCRNVPEPVQPSGRPQRPDGIHARLRTWRQLQCRAVLHTGERCVWGNGPCQAGSCCNSYWLLHTVIIPLSAYSALFIAP